MGKSFFFNTRGMSLVEVLVSLGITVILMSATASMFVTQQRENRALNQKLEMIELKNQIMQAFQNPLNCTWQLAGKTFDTTGVSTTTPSPTIIELGELRQGQNNTSLLLAKNNTRLPGTQTNLLVANVRFSNIVATDNANEYKGNFEISFAEASLARPIRAITIPQTIQTTGSPTATISICGNAASGGGQAFELGGFYVWHRHYNSCQRSNPMTGGCSCPTGFTARVYNDQGYDDGSKTDDRNLLYCYRINATP